MIFYFIFFSTHIYVFKRNMIRTHLNTRIRYTPKWLCSFNLQTLIVYATWERDGTIILVLSLCKKLLYIDWYDISTDHTAIKKIRSNVQCKNIFTFRTLNMSKTSNCVYVKLPHTISIYYTYITLPLKCILSWQFGLRK